MSSCPPLPHVSSPKPEKRVTDRWPSPASPMYVVGLLPRPETTFMPRTDTPGQPQPEGRGEKEGGRAPGTHISVMFSGSALLGSNLGNATMPGEGSLHQIREALHLQDVGQARAALQKPTTSQQKPQSRAMAGPCHLVQDDIPSRQCQPESD